MHFYGRVVCSQEHTHTSVMCSADQGGKSHDSVSLALLYYACIRTRIIHACMAGRVLLAFFPAASRANSHR